MIKEMLQTLIGRHRIVSHYVNKTGKSRHIRLSPHDILDVELYQEGEDTEFETASKYNLGREIKIK